MYRNDGYLVLSLCGWDNQSPHGVLLPYLRDAVLVGFNGNRMVFRGFRRPGNQDNESLPTYTQEWQVEVVGMHPPAEAGMFKHS